MSDILKRLKEPLVMSMFLSREKLYQEGELQREQAAARIEELEAQLAAMTAERDRKDAAIKRQAGAAKTLRQCTLAEVQHIKDNERKEYVASRTLDSEREANAILTDELETYRAAIPRAYAMGLEAAAREASRGSFADGHFIHRHQKAKAIRAMTPPADLVERVLKTKETHTND